MNKDPTATRYTIGQFVVNPSSRSVRSGEGTVRLSVKALAVLESLIEARGRVVSREKLLEAGWKNRVVGEEVLTQAMAELRRAFDDNFRAPSVFQTVHKTGYRLLRVPEMESTPPAIVLDATGFTVEAYSDFLHALELFEFDDHIRIKSALSLLEGVVAACPAHVPSLAYLSIMRMFVALYYGGGEASRRLATEEAENALRMDPQSPEALTAIAFVESVKGEYERSMAHFAAAIAADYRSSEAHKLLGRVLFVLKDFRRAALMLARVSQLLPDDYHHHMLVSKALLGAGQTEESTACLQRGLAELESHAQLRHKGLQARSDLIYYRLALGDTDAGLAGVETLGPSEERQLFYPATGLARAGLLTESIECLERSVSAGWSHYEWLESDPDLQVLQNIPRFARLKSELRAQRFGTA